MLPTLQTSLLPIIKTALSLPDSHTLVLTPHGSSNFTRTFKVVSCLCPVSGDGGDGVDGGGGAEGGDEKDGREEKVFFVKVVENQEGDGEGEGEGEVMFKGEYTSLAAIHNTVPTLSAAAYAYGTTTTATNGSTHSISYLITDFLDFQNTHFFHGGRRSSTSTSSLAQKLAKLHSTAAPIPPGHKQAMFGFPVATCCGSTVQENGFMGSWAEFFAERRLKGVMRTVRARRGTDERLDGLVERVVEGVVPRLLGEGHLMNGEEGGGIYPVLLHGDLWSGNRGWVKIGKGQLQKKQELGEGDELEEKMQEVVFDPSSFWGHSEYEFGIMRFGGFGEEFFREYESFKKKDFPVEEYEDRVDLYELYHQLNHYAIFGGGYKDRAVRIMRNLIGKFGDRRQ